jgi:hypothetical protein
MSGLIRPSIVGPCELYGSKALVEKQIAPAATVLGEDAGSVRLPAVTTYWGAPASTNKSNRGAAVAANLWMAMPKT